METILLKWGTLKGWSNLKDSTIAILKKYQALGMSWGAAQQRDTPEQKQLLCDVVRQLDGTIINDWTNEEMTPEEAVEYIQNYGKPAPSAPQREPEPSQNQP